MTNKIKCPVCGKETIIRLDGKIRKHRAKMAKTNKIKYCPASNQKPSVLRGLKKVVKKMAKAKRMTKNNVLSDRQLQVLEMIVKGFTHKETGLILNISNRTVDNHMAQIKKALNIKDRYNLIRWGQAHI